MSSYEDYDAVSACYDRSRSAVALDDLLALLPEAETPSGRASILDLGCGTGNYLLTLALHGFRVAGLDMSLGMLEQAKRKCGTAGGRCLVGGDLLHLPFPSGHFDAVLPSYVLHHLSLGSAKRTFVETALTEAHRVLKNGGRVAILTSSAEQLRDGFWWTALIPRARDRMIARLTDPRELVETLECVGFTDVKLNVPREAVVQESTCQDYGSLLNPEYRKGDSTWSLVDETELKGAVAELREMISTGAIEQYVAQRDALRKSVGQMTIIAAIKPMDG